MNCQEHQELISADLDAELAAGEEPSLWAHLAHCDECRAWRRDQMTMRREFERWPEETYPAIADGPAPRPATGPKVYRVPRLLAWAAALLLLIQGALVTSSLIRAPETDDARFAGSPEETVETIVLTDQDRVGYSTTENPLMIGRPLTHPDENGG